MKKRIYLKNVWEPLRSRYDSSLPQNRYIWRGDTSCFALCRKEDMSEEWLGACEKWVWSLSFREGACKWRPNARQLFLEERAYPKDA